MSICIIKNNNNIIKEKQTINNYFSEGKNTNKSVNENEFIGIIEIKNLDIKNVFYDFSSPKNTVDLNVMLIEKSDMPDIKNGNLILAAHRGTSKVAYFNELYKICEKDEIIIYYKNKKYIYNYSNRYDVPKNGHIKISRDNEKNTLTLITCKKGTSKQTVFINYLVDTKSL